MGPHGKREVARKDLALLAQRLAAGQVFVDLLYLLFSPNETRLQPCQGRCLFRCCCVAAVFVCYCVIVLFASLVVVVEICVRRALLPTGHIPGSLRHPNRTSPP